MAMNDKARQETGTDEEALEGPDIDTSENDPDGTTKPGGLGKDGTIPPAPNGVAAGHTDTASNFNQEEDENAD